MSKGRGGGGVYLRVGVITKTDFQTMGGGGVNREMELNRAFTVL